MNHFISFKDFSPEYLESIIDQALEIKHNPARYAKALEGKSMYMLFQKTSTRTALSFAFGMTASGGQYIIQNWEDSNFSVGEIQDEVLDLLAFRSAAGDHGRGILAGQGLAVDGRAAAVHHGLELRGDAPACSWGWPG